MARTRTTTSTTPATEQQETVDTTADTATATEQVGEQTSTPTEEELAADLTANGAASEDTAPEDATEDEEDAVNEVEHPEQPEPAQGNDPAFPEPAITDAVLGDGSTGDGSSSDTLAQDHVTAPAGADTSLIEEDVRERHNYVVPADNVARNGEQLAALFQKHGLQNRKVIINEDTSNLDAEVFSADKHAVLFSIDYGNGPDRTLRITDDLYAAGVLPRQIEYFGASLSASKKFGNADARYVSGNVQSQITPSQDRAEAAAEGEATGDGIADGF